MPDEAKGRPSSDGDEPDHREHGGADDAFAPVVFDEDFVRAATLHEPSAAERALAAAQARAEAEAAAREDAYGHQPDEGHDEVDGHEADRPHGAEDHDVFGPPDAWPGYRARYGRDAPPRRPDVVEPYEGLDARGAPDHHGGYDGYGSYDGPHGYDRYGDGGLADFGGVTGFGGFGGHDGDGGHGGPRGDGGGPGSGEMRHRCGGYAPRARGRPARHRAPVRWQRPVAWVLAVVMGVGVIAMAFAAVHRGASGQREEPRQPPSSTELGDALGAAPPGLPVRLPQTTGAAP
ncbi:hypothetical protein WDH52_06950 [Streptomyces sp. TRM70308]|uniref:SCO2584 family spore wall biosynthesis protein n=1 Tax=Streptomyces sp. TRM70308 TaxID=3131932 RepID=UPI003CFEAE2B